jgi:hypothetical protein
MKYKTPDTATVEGVFHAFECANDDDIQLFLREKAFEFERRGWSSVYLLFNEERFLRGELFIEAFFTLSHKALVVSHDVSNTKKKAIFKGISSADSLAHFVLIGHLGKNQGDKYVSAITADEIFEAAFEVIERSKELITFNCVLVECKNNPKLLDIYDRQGFSYLQDDGLVQLFKRV